MRKIPTLIIVLFMLQGLSCKHEVPQPAVIADNGGGGNGGGGNGGGGGSGIPCDPNVIYFNRDILPLLISNCAKPGCHDAATSQDGINMTSYQSIMSAGIVDPYDLNEDLWEVINETDPDDIMPPPGNTPLTAQQKNLIRDWILQGAQNLTCDGGCDTLNVTFAATIKPIIDMNCKGCHSGAIPPTGVALTNYSEVAAVAFNGLLIGVTTHAPGFVPMPPSGPGLTACQITQIQKWVSSGSPNN